MVMVVWPWLHGHGCMVMVAGSWLHGHGSMAMVAWSWLHGNGCMVVWSWLHGHGCMIMVAWSWLYGHGYQHYFNNLKIHSQKMTYFECKSSKQKYSEQVILYPSHCRPPARGLK